MAKRTPTAKEGETRFGPNADNQNINQGILYIESGGPNTDLQKAGKGSVLAMDAIDVNGAVTTWYLYIGSDGTVYVKNALPTDTESTGGGTKVGGQ